MSKQSAINRYQKGKRSFIQGLTPEAAVNLPGREVLPLLAKRLGEAQLQRALLPGQQIPSPVQAKKDGRWLQKVNMVGINVRTIQSFWNVVKYALTLPATQSSIHLLPIWEPGVVASLYGMASWQINGEFFSTELQHLVPQLNTVEKQLAAVVNLLHAMGKTVGMDVIPHTDRYSEMALAQPHFFEWLQRKEDCIVNHREHLHTEVQGSIMRWLLRHGSAIFGQAYPTDTNAFFHQQSEAERLRILFGLPEDYQGRVGRRASLVDWLYHQGYEPVPATMAPPYRGLEVDPDPAARVVDYAGREWRDYRITQPEKMSRVFGPLSRYKFYARLDDNQDWGIDFTRVRTEVWNYFTAGYAKVQATYGFDFMRGDMSHVQMRSEGVPIEVDEYYDPLLAVKAHIQQSAAYFGYFAESFLAPDGVMAYGNEVKHLQASQADTTLGDLQSMSPGSELFQQHWQRYLDIAATSKVVPNFTIITGDKDDPRFDAFYQHAMATRLFVGLFCTALPSYHSLGFEQRDIHSTPLPNEYYTKLYVFQLDTGPKATQGPYRWGKNRSHFVRVNRLRKLSEKLSPAIADTSTKWLRTPGEAQDGVVVWQQGQYILAANFSTETQPLPIIPALDNVWSLYFHANKKQSKKTSPSQLTSIPAEGYLIMKQD